MTIPFSLLTLIAASLIYTGFFLNQLIGPALIMLGMMAWAGVIVLSPARSISSLARSGVLIWLLPIWCAASYIWSDYPQITLRQTMWLFVTIALSALVAKTVSFSRILWIILVVNALGCLASIFKNTPYYDGMTGIVSYGGIFINKNTLAFCGFITALTALHFLMLYWRSQLRLPLMGTLVLGAVMSVLARSIAVDVIMFWSLGLYLTGIAPVKFLGMRDQVAKLSVIVYIVASIVFSVLAYEFQEVLLAAVQKDPTLTGRTVLWEFASHLIRLRPLFGVGYQAFWVQGNGEAEYLWEIMFISARGGFHFHNIFYQVGVELGWPGMILTGLFVVVVLGSSFRSVLRGITPEGLYSFCLLLAIIIYESQSVNLYWPFSPIFFIVLVLYLGNRKQQKVEG